MDQRTFDSTWPRTERPATGPLVLRPLDLAHDMGMLHDWVNRPYARFWGLMGKSLDEVTRIYREQLERGERKYIACREDTGAAMFLMEVYDPRQDELGHHYPAQPGDCGYHLMLAPPDAATPGMTYQLMSAACSFLFSDPAVKRVVAEPDVRNRKILTRLMQLGFQLRGAVHLPYKTGMLVTLERAQFDAHLAGHAPARPHLRLWPLRVRLYLEMGRVARTWRALRARPH